MTGLVVVLCKPPESRDCKTRLAAGVGRDTATEIYRRCLDRVVASAAATGSAVRLAVAGPPEELASVVHRQAPSAELVRQAGATFAERQRHEIERGLRDRFRPVALVASDLAEPPDEQLRWALRAADGGAVAIVPSPDGGYAVLASGVALPELAAVPMSHDRTLRLLCSALRRAGRRVEISVRTLADIDTAEDAERFRECLPGGVP